MWPFTKSKPKRTTAEQDALEMAFVIRLAETYARQSGIQFIDAMRRIGWNDNRFNIWFDLPENSELRKDLKDL